jgi:uncharacterized protein involved in exopolysaccharide biosynthesis
MPDTPDFRPQDSSHAPLDLLDLVHLFRSHVRWWAIPTVVCAVLAAAYSFVAPRQWQATQALIIRPEAASVSEQQLGEFSDLSEMKTLQETILELAKSQGVIQATLCEVGPPASYRRPEEWPTPVDVEEFRECVDMRPPGGAEFGKTEVFYLSVHDTDRRRAAALAAVLCEQLVERMQDIRGLRAQGMVVELERTVAMAEHDLANRTTHLSAFETQIGADLAELRNLNAEIGGQSEVSQELQAIEAERRANSSQRRENERLLSLLVAAQDDPQQLLATPGSLLQSQPAVAQLKQALVAAEVHTASLLGSRSQKHPFVVAAREAEQRLRHQLHNEIAVAIRALQVDVELNADREEALSVRWTTGRERLSRLAGGRAEYARLLASVENHTRLVEAARKNLADARAHQAGARSASVISRIDGVETGVYPIGPGRRTITAAGGVGGLLLGLGVVFLFARNTPTSEPTANRVAIADDYHLTPRPVPVRDRERGFEMASRQNDIASNKRARPEPLPKRPASQLPSNAFGIYQGMTLEDAIHGADSTRPRRPEW